MKKSHTKKYATNSLPLSGSHLRTAAIKVPRHHFEPQPITRRSLVATTLKAGEIPSVTTRLTPLGTGRTRRWRIEVEIADGDVSEFQTAPIKPVMIDREVLAQRRAQVVVPSMPDDGTVLTIRPKQTRLKPFLIRFGDLRYRPTTIFPPDGRQPYYDTNYPWRCLVRITTARGWSGSGVLIGPRHVLTASHCVNWPSGWLTVDVLYTNNSSLGTSGAFLAYAETQVGLGPISDKRQR